MISSVTVGALCAALIGATATLLGLLIAKENKTSEFRQLWIDSVRDEISQFLVHFNAIYDATHAQYGDLSSKLTVLSPLYANLNEAAFKISLRLNPEEPEGQAVLAALNELQKLSIDEVTLRSADIRPLEADLLIKSKTLLKKEWNRVKSGEPVFRFAKWAALTLTPLLFAAVLVSGWIAFSAEDSGDSGPSEIITPVNRAGRQSPPDVQSSERGFSTSAPSAPAQLPSLPETAHD